MGQVLLRERLACLMSKEVQIESKLNSMATSKSVKTVTKAVKRTRPKRDEELDVSSDSDSDGATPYGCCVRDACC